jgi:aminoglycoside phosphotransferase (APT) family kinase protein
VTPGSAAQLDLWYRYAERELDGRVHEPFEEAVAWLRANQPQDEEIVLCWGDARPGNIIWRDFRAACATDFEAANIGTPLLDLGWWLMFDRWSHETPGHPRLPGEPTREEQRDRYAALTGRDVSDSLWYEVFAAARYCAIVVRVMNRMVLRGQMPHDQTFWLDNPATVCLRQLQALI